MAVTGTVSQDASFLGVGMSLPLKPTPVLDFDWEKQFQKILFESTHGQGCFCVGIENLSLGIAQDGILMIDRLNNITLELLGLAFCEKERYCSKSVG